MIIKPARLKPIVNTNARELAAINKVLANPFKVDTFDTKKFVEEAPHLFKPDGNLSDLGKSHLIQKLSALGLSKDATIGEFIYAVRTRIKTKLADNIIG